MFVDGQSSMAQFCMQRSLENDDGKVCFGYLVFVSPSALRFPDMDAAVERLDIKSALRRVHRSSFASFTELCGTINSQLKGRVIHAALVRTESTDVEAKAIDGTRAVLQALESSEAFQVCEFFAEE